MKITSVKLVDGGEQKSVQELEQQFQQEHEEQQQQQQEEQKQEEENAQNEEHQQEQSDENQTVEIQEEHVLSFFKNKFNKELTSVEDLLKEKEPEIPYEDVNAFLKFKKETGRGIEDFMKISVDYDKIDETALLLEYLKVQNPELSIEDINFELEEKYGFDADLDSESDIKRKEIARKKELVKAKEYFTKQREQYLTPIETKGFTVPDAEKELYESYKKQLSDSNRQVEENQKRSEHFTQKTEELFSRFDGFEFELDTDKKVKYKPAEAEQIKKNQLSISNFISKFLDDNGYLKDASMYHKSLAVASDPEAFAKFFYEKGKADQLEQTNKSINNIDMSKPNIQQQSVSSQGGVQVRSVDNKFDGKLRIKLRE